VRVVSKVLQYYFNFAYMPIYDLITAHFDAYQKLHNTCVDKLELDDGDKILCAGVGTGNEVTNVLGIGKKISIVGVDNSYTALRKARQKAIACGKEIEIVPMDVQNLEFTTGFFDKVLCLHVMDWVEDESKATAEIMRVLKDGGKFVITYPADKENINLGFKILRDSFLSNGNRGKFGTIYPLLLATLLGGIVYLPLLFRPQRRTNSRLELETILSEVANGSLQIEEYPLYNDYIVYGRKQVSKGGI